MTEDATKLMIAENLPECRGIYKKSGLVQRSYSIMESPTRAPLIF